MHPSGMPIPLSCSGASRRLEEPVSTFSLIQVGPVDGAVVVGLAVLGETVGLRLGAEEGGALVGICLVGASVTEA